MDTRKMGQFISELRKSHNMTQKDLATKLNITDKSVSKWERGLSCPDISLLNPLADILGVSINEILNGEKSSAEVANVEASVVNALQYADNAVKSMAKTVQNISTTVFTCLLLLGILTCAIVDIAISGALTWSLIPISACVFGWLTFAPAIKYGARGISMSLIAFSVLVVPFLFILSFLIDSGGLLLSIGISISIVSIIYLWCVVAICKKLWSRKLIACAISLLLALPLSLVINLILSRIILTPLFDIWDALSFGIGVVVIVALVFMDYSWRRKQRTN